MSYDLGVLILRLVVGGLMIGHGSQKLFGWFGGHGLAATSAYFGIQLRLRPAGFWTLLAGLTEAGGGLLFALGLLSPLGSLGVIAPMLIAIILAHIYIGSLGMEGAYEAMGTGEVDLAWAKEHHSAWVEGEKVSSSSARPSATPAE